LFVDWFLQCIYLLVTGVELKTGLTGTKVLVNLDTIKNVDG
jgi:hypothetical protein